MSDKGILTKVVEEKLAAKLDELVKLKGIWESVDGLAFKLTLSALDDNLGEKIPEPYKSGLTSLFTAVLDEGDYETAVGNAFEFLDNVVDIPGLDDETEAMLFEGLATFVIAIILKIKKHEAEGE